MFRGLYFFSVFCSLVWVNLSHVLVKRMSQESHLDFLAMHWFSIISQKVGNHVFFEVIASKTHEDIKIHSPMVCLHLLFIHHKYNNKFCKC